MRTARVALSAIPLALALMIVLAPVASAQVVPLPEPDDVVTDVGAAGEVLDGATGPVEDTVSQTTNTVNDTVPDTTEPLPDEVKEVVRSTTGTVKETLEPVLNEVGGTLPGPSDLISGNLTDPTRGDNGGNNDGGPDGSTGTHDRDKARVRGTRTAATADRGIDLGGIAVAISSEARLHRTSSPAAGPSLLQQAGEAAVEGLVRVAFPLLLAIMVAAFIAFQGRVGRNDPKLLLAPLDPKQATLTFR